uniref:Uncharacterized protein n=1 Tax=Rhizophora mucronata TaxID=61149 RepID=A0A2P2QGH4_RHIMU
MVRYILLPLLSLSLSPLCDTYQPTKHEHCLAVQGNNY